MDERLLAILACPRCRGELRHEEDRDILICQGCSFYYEIREGIPVLLPDSGKPLEEGSR